MIPFFFFRFSVCQKSTGVTSERSKPTCHSNGTSHPTPQLAVDSSACLPRSPDGAPRKQPTWKETVRTHVRLPATTAQRSRSYTLAQPYYAPCTHVSLKCCSLSRFAGQRTHPHSPGASCVNGRFAFGDAGVVVPSIL
jgi:hypothetical protein